MFSRNCDVFCNGLAYKGKYRTTKSDLTIHNKFTVELHGVVIPINHGSTEMNVFLIAMKSKCYAIHSRINQIAQMTWCANLMLEIECGKVINNCSYLENLQWD